jgi:pimeloyl-ACP methyl ester carboxylesterase
MPEADVVDEHLVRTDGRTVAWTQTGEGIPVLRLPGTPGARWSLPTDRSQWTELGLRVITTERPGFGRSTRLAGRQFREHSDDLAAILDHLGLERVYLIGGSGGGPHVLAFAAHHPDRVIAATVRVGYPLLKDDEYDEMVPLNAAVFRAGRAGDEQRVRELLADEHEDTLQSGPMAALDLAMATAPQSDREVMNDPVWRASVEKGLTEAFAQGIDGWVDESLALDGRWTDIDLTAIRTTVTWWHGRADRNCPFPAAQRLVDSLPTATMRELTGGGHLEPASRAREILEELLAR